MNIENNLFMSQNEMQLF